MKKYILLIAIITHSISSFSQKAGSLYEQLSLQEAISLYESKLKKNDNDGEAIYKLANAYRLNNESVKAESWFAKAVNTSEKPMAKFYYAKTLLMNGKTTQAKYWFSKYKLSLYGKEAIRIEGFIELCRLIEENKVKEGNYEISKSIFNSEMMDFSPSYYGEELLFVSNRNESKGSSNKLDKWTNEKFTDLYVTSPKNGFSVKRLSKKINSSLHESSGVFSSDLAKLYFTRSNHLKGKSKQDSEQNIRLQIMESNKDGKDWSKPSLLSFNNKNYSFCHPTLSADNKSMIFASDMPGGYGGMDLYIVKKIGEKWGIPENLGNKINTTGNEVFPFLDKQSNLYFSSNFHAGYGGLDIFKTNKQDGRWGKPRNIGLPLNSLKDDFGVISKDDFKSGYFSSDRSGQDEIYSFKIGEKIIIKGIVINCNTGEAIPQADVIIYKDNKEYKVLKSDKEGKFSFETSANTRILDAVASKSLFSTNSSCSAKQTFNVKDEPILSLGLNKVIEENTGLSLCGLALNKDCNYLLNGVKVTIINLCNGMSFEVMSDKDGKFNFPLMKNCRYKIIAEKKHFNAIEKIFKTDSTMIDCFDLELSMVSEFDLRDPSLGFKSSNRILLKEGAVIDLYNIYFDLDKYNLRVDGTEELKWVSKVLRDYPKMKVQISAHTDSRASDSYNITLSKNRAESVRQYLLKEGFNDSRITYKGYGESKLKNRCANGILCNELEHQRNRRVQFTIVSFEGEVVVSKEWKSYTK